MTKIKNKFCKLFLGALVSVTTLFAANTVFATEAYETVEAPKLNDANTFANVTVNGSRATSLYLNTSGTTYFKFTTGNRSVNMEYYNLYIKAYDSYNPRVSLYTDEDMVNCIYDRYTTLNNSAVDVNFGKLNNNTTYYGQIEGSSWEGRDNEVDYKVMLTGVADDCGNMGATATAVSVGKEVRGCHENRYDADVYSFKADSKEGFYWFELSSISGYIGDYGVYSDSDCTNLIMSCPDGGTVSGHGVTTGDTESFNCGKLQKNQTYYVKVASASYQNVNYKFKISYKKDDAKDYASSAKTLSLNTTKTYAIDNRIDVDYFKFKTNSFKEYTLSFSNTGVYNYYIMVEVYSGKDCLEKQRIFSEKCYYKESLGAAEAKLKLKANRNYYIKVYSYYDVGKYKLGVKTTEPQSLKATSKSKKVTLNWKKVSGASGYEVYRATSKNGKYTKIKTIKSGKTVKYVDSKKLKTNKKYYYKVRAYKKVNGKKYYTAYTSVKSVKVRK